MTTKTVTAVTASKPIRDSLILCGAFNNPPFVKETIPFSPQYYNIVSPKNCI